MASDGITSGLEGAVTHMTQWTVDTAKAMDAEIGPRPLFTEKLPERVQARQGSVMYNDPAAWESMLRAHGWQGPGSDVPKNVIEYGQRLTRLLAKYPDEAHTGEQAQRGAALTSGQQVAPTPPEQEG